MTIEQKALGFMLDIETLGLAETAIVLQAAFIPFYVDDIHAPLSPIKVSFAIQPQIDIGRSWSADTLKWWLRQANTLPLMESLTDNNTFGLQDNVQWLADRLGDWLKNCVVTELWCKGAGFDTRIMKNLFLQLGVTWPFGYSIERDLRTLMAAAGMDNNSIPRANDLALHSAMDDARHQITQLAVARKRLGRG